MWENIAGSTLEVKSKVSYGLVPSIEGWMQYCQDPSAAVGMTEKEEVGRPHASANGRLVVLVPSIERWMEYCQDPSAAQTDTFAGAKAEENASACFGRDDR
jgi:hypothetical protein